MSYTGAVIRESLTDASILDEFELVKREIEKVDEEMETPWLDVWTLDFVRIPAEKIDDFCAKLSRLIDTSHCDNWYADFRDDDWLYVVFPEKVFKVDRHDTASYEAMKAYALAHQLPDYQLPEP